MRLPIYIVGFSLVAATLPAAAEGRGAQVAGTVAAAPVGASMPLALAQDMDNIRRERFRERDQNRDRRLTQAEYGGHPGNFRWLDRDNDGLLTEEEFLSQGRGGQPHPEADTGVETEAAGTASSFTTADRNGDHFLTRDEWRPGGGEFDRLDTNNDGRVSQTEFYRRTPEELKARYVSRDLNRDGRITPNEWQSDEDQGFDFVDRDNDMQVSLREYMDRSVVENVTKFDVRDKNNDGYISRDEWPNSGGEFERLDTNRDGRVTAQEFLPSGRTGTPGALFDAMDRNNNGVVSRGEWTDPRNFDVFDRNDDGRVTLNEYMNPPAADSVELRYEQKDTNNDGVISRGEWINEQASFRSVDRNSDGVIILSEYRNAPATSGNPREVEFERLDRNNDDVLVSREWSPSEAITFAAADRNRDGAVTRWEFLNAVAATPRQETFDDIDRNDNGVITRWEWRGESYEFERLDVNRDGVVTLREYGATGTVPMPPPQNVRDARFRQLDRDNNGTITRGEWLGEPALFDVIDRSKDGLLTRFEYLSTSDITSYFGRLDRDDDGRLSRTEWYGTRRFHQAADQNRDGFVSLDEFLGL